MTARGLRAGFRLFLNKRDTFRSISTQSHPLAKDQDKVQGSKMRQMEKEMDPEIGATISDKGTTWSMLSQMKEPRVIISKVSPYGFTLASDITLNGPCVFLPQYCFSWKVKNIDDINEASLSFFAMLEPKPENLIIGTGLGRQKLSADVIKFLKDHKISYEVHPTEVAIATFNFQVADNRWVMAALIPPEPLKRPKDLTGFVRQRMETHLDAVSSLPEHENYDDSELFFQPSEKKKDREAIGTQDPGSVDVPSSTQAVTVPYRQGQRSPLGGGISYGNVTIEGQEAEKSMQSDSQNRMVTADAKSRTGKSDERMKDSEDKSSDSNDGKNKS
ncbi:uncharacterized protein LOC127860030 [Dreissena polymorpha]|uniref:NADH dehydrogenase [ubiquinone] 1 alpha subcomplex assembly factor 3 n=1 Tax=Dreissena polymorpha TaxID=45954 RepID=A0A9D4NFI5_DREPO|nr:uncharacterized protein LOC127860030 [Dreissena polymorpha]KAH3893381.1 hypothetical protein DPMN_017528 [Dreissena polymorpha]